MTDVSTDVELTLPSLRRGSTETTASKFIAKYLQPRLNNKTKKCFTTNKVTLFLLTQIVQTWIGTENILLKSYFHKFSK